MISASDRSSSRFEKYGAMIHERGLPPQATQSPCCSATSSSTSPRASHSPRFHCDARAVSRAPCKGGTHEQAWSALWRTPRLRDGISPLPRSPAYWPIFASVCATRSRCGVKDRQCSGNRRSLRNPCSVGSSSPTGRRCRSARSSGSSSDQCRRRRSDSTRTHRSSSTPALTRTEVHTRRTTHGC